MYAYRYRLSLRLEHPSMNLTRIVQQISELLPGLLSGEVRNIGEERVTPKGKKVDGHYSKSSFGFSFSDNAITSEKQTLDQSVLETLAELEPCRDLFHEFTHAGGSLILFVGLFLDKNSGIIFHPQAIKRIADFNIEVQLDIYPPENNSASPR